jgi:hypothetical protein
MPCNFEVNLEIVICILYMYYRRAIQKCRSRRGRDRIYLCNQCISPLKYVAVSFICRGNWSTWRKQKTCCKSLTNSITKCCIEYTSPSTGFKLTTLEVICTDCTGRYDHEWGRSDPGRTGFGAKWPGFHWSTAVRFWCGVVVWVLNCLTSYSSLCSYLYFECCKTCSWVLYFCLPHN